MILKKKINKINKVELRKDLIAGVTVALLLIPQSLAYAELAGLPPQYGLFAALLPPLLAAYFGSSPQLATGPVAVLSLMTFSALSPIVEPGTQIYIEHAILLTFMLGILFLSLGYLKLGNIVSFLSHPVIYGFTNAAAIIIGTTQIATFLGVSVPKQEHHFETMILVFEQGITSTSLPTLFLGVWVLFLMFTIKKINPKIPYVLIAVLFGIILSWVFQYPTKVVGEIAGSLGSLALPSLNIQRINDLLPAVVAMGLIGFTETVAISQSLAIKNKTRFNPNKELIGQGIANLVGSFNSSQPVTGSLARSALNYKSGAQSWKASMFTTITVLIVILFFTKYLYHLPVVVLAAIIVLSITSLLDFKKIKLIWKVNKFDAYVSIITFITTLYFAPELEKGVFVGVGISTAYFIYKNTHPRVAFLSLYKDSFFHDAETYNLKVCSNVAIVRLDAPLFFANSTYFEEEVIRYLSKHKSVTDVLFVGAGINEIDATGEEQLEHMTNNLLEGNKHVYFSAFKKQVLDRIASAELLENIGREHVFPTTKDAVEFLLKHLETEHKHHDKDSCPLRNYKPYKTRTKHHLSSKHHIHRTYEKIFKR